MNMELTLQNTLSGKKEVFTPITEGVVKMYNCGPTVYDYAHIGNLRSYVFADLLRRTLEWNGYTVTQVMNITDIGHLTSDADSGDDKMVKGLKREGLPLTLEGLASLAQKYEAAFKADLEALNIETPTYFPRATTYLQDEIALVSLLVEKGVAYATADGVYFDTEKFPAYGKLGGLTPLSDAAHRIESEGKKNPRDFVLWKLSKDDHLGFESPFGVGFPGWHIECSAMSRKLIGQPFDIHTGGIDHIPVHHNNEIAQSEAAYGVPLAHYWLHGAFLNVTGAKMAKSAGTFLTLQDLTQKGISPLAYRYFLLGGHYRSQMDFSFEALTAAQNGLNNLIRTLGTFGEGGTVNAEWKEAFTQAINDDLSFPQALAVLHDMLKSPLSHADKRATALSFDAVLGLNLNELLKRQALLNADIPEAVSALLTERNTARDNKDWKKADDLRTQIRALGFEIDDSATGAKLTRK